MNPRPSGYEPDELPGCSTPRQFRRIDAAHLARARDRDKKVRMCADGRGTALSGRRGERYVLGRPGSDLLFHALRHSTIGAEEFNGRVRDGIGCRLLAITTRPAKNISSGYE